MYNTVKNILLHFLIETFVLSFKKNKKPFIAYFLVACLSMFLAYQTWYTALSNELFISQTCLNIQQKNIIKQLQRKKTLITRYIKPLSKEKAHTIRNDFNSLLHQPFTKANLFKINQLINQCISISEKQSSSLHSQNFKKQNNHIDQSLNKCIHRYNAEVKLLNQQINTFPYSFIAKYKNITSKNTLPVQVFKTITI